MSHMKEAILAPFQSLHLCRDCTLHCVHHSTEDSINAEIHTTLSHLKCKDTYNGMPLEITVQHSTLSPQEDWLKSIFSLGLKPPPFAIGSWLSLYTDSRQSKLVPGHQA